MALGWSIKVGHDKYRVIFTRLFNSTEKDATMREEAFLTYKRDLFGHHEGEEKHLFPAMIKIPALREMAYNLEMEHRCMKLIIKDLAEIGYDRPMWKYRFEPLYAIHLHHWEVEEGELIPFLSQYFTQGELEKMNEKFDDTVDSYNRRPLSDFK